MSAKNDRPYLGPPRPLALGLHAVRTGGLSGCGSFSPYGDPGESVAHSLSRESPRRRSLRISINIDDHALIGSMQEHFVGLRRQSMRHSHPLPTLYPERN